jgi:hypothetical protein
MNGTIFLQTLGGPAVSHVWKRYGQLNWDILLIISYYYKRCRICSAKQRIPARHGNAICSQSSTFAPVEAKEVFATATLLQISLKLGQLVRTVMLNI